MLLAKSTFITVTATYGRDLPSSIPETSPERDKRRVRAKSDDFVPIGASVVGLDDDVDGVPPVHLNRYDFDPGQLQSAASQTLECSESLQCQPHT